MVSLSELNEAQITVTIFITLWMVSYFSFEHYASPKSIHTFCAIGKMKQKGEPLITCSFFHHGSYCTVQRFTAENHMAAENLTKLDSTYMWLDYAVGKRALKLDKLDE